MKRSIFILGFLLLGIDHILEKHGDEWFPAKPTAELKSAPIISYAKEGDFPVLHPGVLEEELD